MERKEILGEAERCVCGQREQDYGSPESNFAIIAKLWGGYLDTEISTVDVAMMMVLLKVARIKNGGGSGDSFVDIAGYAAVGGELAGVLTGKTCREESEVAQIKQESAQIEQESAQAEQENAQTEQENAHTEIVEEPSTKAAEIQSEPEQAETKEDVPRKGFGKWSEYMGKALSTLEQNLIIKGMTEEGYTLSQISVVVRLSQQTICNRKKKIDWTGSEEKQEKE